MSKAPKVIEDHRGRKGLWDPKATLESKASKESEAPKEGEAHKAPKGQLAIGGLGVRPESKAPREW